MIASLLEEAPADRPALSAGDRVLTYAELRELSARLEEQLEAAGDLRGQRVAFVAPNSPELVAGLFAAWRLGAVAVPLSSRLRERELQLMLADAEPAVVVSVAAHGGYSFAEVLPRILPPSVRRCLLGADEVAFDEASSPEALEERDRRHPVHVGHDRDPEGRARQARARGRRLALSRRHVATHGGRSLWGDRSDLACVRAYLVARNGGRGGRGRSSSTRASRPAPLLRALEARDATVLHGSPTLFRTLLKARPDGLPGIRTGLVAGAPCPSDLLEALDERGTRILNCYGLSETGAVTCVRLDDPPVQRHETVGRASPAYEARVTDGELEVRGEHLTPGYYRRPDETAEAFRDGWFRTGDLAEIDDGYIRIVGRAKEIVHVGGFNVVPAEVEAALLAHPDVANAAVLGVPDERMGEALAAYVSPRPGAELSATDLIAFTRSRIAGYKVPYAIEILPELPLLPSGKPDRKALSR